MKGVYVAGIDESIVSFACAGPGMMRVPVLRLLKDVCMQMK
jgi:hypothetical protein